MTSPQGGGLRKVRRATFVQVPSSTIRDRRLSFRARGVLAWLLDKPDGWDVRATVIAEEGTEGREAVEGALRELRRLGYYRLERRRLPDGSFTMGTAVAEEPVDAWAASHEAHDGRAVPVRVNTDGTVTELEPTSAPVTGFPAPVDRASAEQAPADRSPTQTETQTERDVLSVSGVRHQGPAASASEAHACELCDNDGTAYVLVDGEEVGVVCTHDSTAANVRRVRARREALAATPKTTPRERELRDRHTDATPEEPSTNV